MNVANAGPVISLFGGTFGGNNDEFVLLPNVIFVTDALADGLQSRGSMVLTAITFGVLLVWSRRRLKLLVNGQPVALFVVVITYTPSIAFFNKLELLVLVCVVAGFKAPPFNVQANTYGSVVAPFCSEANVVNDPLGFSELQLELVTGVKVAFGYLR